MPVKQRAQDHRLDVTVALPDRYEVEVANAEAEPDEEGRGADADEEAQRPIGRKAAHDRDRRAQDVVRQALDQP